MKKSYVLLALAASLVASGFTGTPSAMADGPMLSVISDDVLAGQAMEVEGSGFSPGEMVSFALDGQLTVSLGEAPTDEFGEITESLSVPVFVVSGQYELAATGQSSNFLASATVSITGNGQYFLIKFSASGGKVSIAAKAVAVNATYGSLPTPSRTGYTFQGWFTASTSGTKVTSATKLATASDKTIYAQWKAKSFKVTFVVNGGKALKTKTKTVSMGKTYGTMPTTSKTGYSFLGWYTAKSGGTKVTKTTVFS